MAVQARMVRADCLRVGDVHAALGTVDEIRRDDTGLRVVFVGWTGGRCSSVAHGHLFNLIARGPRDYPAWFSEAAEDLADYGFYGDLVNGWNYWAKMSEQPGSHHQWGALYARALEIQAERRNP